MIALSALDARNPLAFLAAIGVLRLAGDGSKAIRHVVVRRRGCCLRLGAPAAPERECPLHPAETDSAHGTGAFPGNRAEAE
jgi:hypothetical protein